jgi:hypothetical protein
MARKQEVQAKGIGRLVGAARAMKQLFTRGRGAGQEADSRESARQAGTSRQSSSSSASDERTAPLPGRVTRRQTDIPLDVIGQAYTPPNTSSKAGFRSDGSDHQKDQEFAMGVSDDRWNDEDQFTNKSGDPRIGTHRRTYEPAEASADSRK